MIKQGKNGSIVLFWNEQLVSSLPLGKHTYEDYMKRVEDFIIASMREAKMNIKDLVFHCQRFCSQIQKRKDNCERITKKEHESFCVSILTLVRLELIDFDDVILIAPCKKPRKSQLTLS